MGCFQALVLGVLLLGVPPSSASMSASPHHTEDATSFTSSADSDSPASTASVRSRFPPRVYSFDPRPNIDPDDVIFKFGDPGPPVEMTSDAGDHDKDSGRVTASGANFTTEPTDLTTPQTRDDDKHSQQGDREDADGLVDGDGKIPGHTLPVIPAVVADPPQADDGDDEVERPRAIVDVQSDGLSGEVSYIIHPDNLPPPIYTPLKNLSLSSHPVAKWRPDIFMKVCCSKPDPTPVPDPTPMTDSSQTSLPPEVKSGHFHLASITPSSLTQEEKETEGHLLNPEEEETVKIPGTNNTHHREEGDTEDSQEDLATTLLPEIVDDTNTQRSSEGSLGETLLGKNGTHPRPDIPSNHTPRYEEASSSTYQDVTNFLKDIANSEGFKNAFLGDLIKNFGNLDQNAMKLIYSLLIRPLEGAHSSNRKQDRVGMVTEATKGGPLRMPITSQDLMVLGKDRLPLRDRPANGFKPFQSIFPPSRPPSARRPPLRPSSLVRQERPSVSSDESWRPSRSYGRLPSNGRRGDEGVDVITAPPFQNFEVVLGSSLNHDIRKNGGIGPQGFPIPPKTPGLPFDKLTLGLEMPPPDALEALPPGSVLIPPSQILGRPKLPQIHPNRNGASSIEMPLKEFLPNLPFFNQPSRLRPPAQPQIQDIPPRLPAILSSLLPGAPPPRLARPQGPVVQPPRPSGPMSTSIERPVFSDQRHPTGPPPPVTKLTPPGQRMPPIVPTVRLPKPTYHQESVSSSFVRPDAAPDSASGPVFVTLYPPSLSAPDAASPLDQMAMEATADHGTMSDNQPSMTGEQEAFSGMETHVEEYVPDENKDYQVESGIFTSDSQQHPGTVYYHDTPPEYVPDYYDLYYHEYYNGQTGGTGGGEDSPPAADVDNTGQYHDDTTGTHYSVNSDGHNGNVVSVSTTTPLSSSFSPPLHDSHLHSHHSNEDESYLEVHQSDLASPYVEEHQPELDDPYLKGHQLDEEETYMEVQQPDLGGHQPDLRGHQPDLEGHQPDLEGRQPGLKGHQHDLDEPYEESHLPDLDDPYLQSHHPVLYDILDIPSDTLMPTLTEQEKNDLQMLLQNHRMASALAEGNGTVVNILPTAGDGSLSDARPTAVVESTVVSSPANSDSEISTGSGHEHYPDDATGYHESWEPALAPVIPSDDEAYSKHNTSISQLWNNVRLIPLAPELFNDSDNEDDMNLTSLFQDAVPLSPSSPQDDLALDLNSDLEELTVKSGDGHVTITEEVLLEDDKANAKFMAYVLIGACCGLALLSITGVIVILRFKKTCGSRQIKTRTRLTEQDSVENISRRVENLTLGGESGHKLGSWFTGRNEQFGSGKLRSNMALPAVHDLKREKNGTSGSTRDLLSISSESSGSSSPNQPQRGIEASGKGEEEEPRASWLHDEYRASGSDLSQAGAQDLAYIPHQYHQQTRGNSNSATAKSPHHQRYHQESSVEVEHLERSVRDRRYTGQSRQEGRYGPQYIRSMDSEELEERMTEHDPRYTTDSELDDGTTQYDEDESRDPSHYFSNSRDLEDIMSSRRGDPDTMTSQELGENLSRDLKQYQSRRVNRLHQQQQPLQQQKQETRELSQQPETSSQEVEGEDDSRELRRSQSQVSFSRDNVQNEVFLEFDSMLRQHGQYLQSEPPTASTLGRASRGTDHTNLSVSRANTPDSIDLPEDFPLHSHRHDHTNPPPSPPSTPPRFSPPPPPPRPPKPGHLSEPGTPSPQASRARPPSPGHSPPSPPRSNQRPVYWTSEEERLI